MDILHFGTSGTGEETPNSQFIYILKGFLKLLRFERVRSIHIEYRPMANVIAAVFC